MLRCQSAHIWQTDPDEYTEHNLETWVLDTLGAISYEISRAELAQAQKPFVLTMALYV